MMNDTRIPTRILDRMNELQGLIDMGERELHSRRVTGFRQNPALREVSDLTLSRTCAAANAKLTRLRRFVLLEG